MANIKKSPAFQFYPSDFLASKRVNRMSAEQQGGYIRLLCFCWNDADLSLLDDDEELSELSKISIASLRVVKEAFKKHPTKPGYLTHERLEIELKRQTDWRKKCSDGGKKSSENRYLGKGTSTKAKLKANSSSSSSLIKKDTPLPPLIHSPAKGKQEGVGVFQNKDGEGKAGAFKIDHHLNDDDRIAARKSAQGWDLHHLMSVYDEGVKVRGIPNHPAKAFISWCGSYTKGKPPA